MSESTDTLTGGLLIQPLNEDPEPTPDPEPEPDTEEGDEE